VRDDRDTDRRHDHQSNGEEPDGPGRRPQVSQRREESRPVQERRQHSEEDELGLQLELGHPGNETDREPAEDEQDGVRDVQRGSDREERRRGEDERERDDTVL
jgi:hypothetical protein